ncbi:hypothetical protein Csa_023396 [Cucumis sativus]|nr:hypothetical protein Csa_023396 [Cucumis sativus]
MCWNIQSQDSPGLEDAGEGVGTACFMLLSCSGLCFTRRAGNAQEGYWVIAAVVGKNQNLVSRIGLLRVHWEAHSQAQKTQIFPHQPDPPEKSRVGQSKTGPEFLGTLNPRNINSAAYFLLLFGRYRNPKVSSSNSIKWVREREVSVKGGTRPTLSVLGVAVVASISRRVDAPPVHFQLLVSVHITGASRRSEGRPLELGG